MEPGIAKDPIWVAAVFALLIVLGRIEQLQPCRSRIEQLQPPWPVAVTLVRRRMSVPQYIVCYSASTALGCWISR